MADTLATTVNEERLSRHNLWAFSLGGIGRDMAYNLWNAFILLCILQTKNIDVAQFGIISTIIIVCRIFDGLNDPIMGGIVESTATKLGKFKPWILIGLFTNCVILYTTFAVPLSGTAFIIFFPFAYILWDITYTMNDIGYWAMMPSLTSNNRDRDKLSSIANICAGIGGGIIMISVPFLTTGKFAIGGNAVTAYRVLPIIVCAVFIGCQLMTCFCVKEKALPPVMPKSDRIGIKHMFKVIKNNDQLKWMSLCMLLYNAGASLVSVGFLTYYIYFTYGYEGVTMLVFTIISGISAGISIFYPILTKRFTRKQLCIGCIILTVIGYIGMLLTGLLWKGSGSYYMLAGCMALASIGQAVIYMVITVSVANTIEYNQLRTGKRDDGIIFSVRPFMAKMGSALQMVIITVVFTALKIADITNQISVIENQSAAKLIGDEEKARLIEDIISRIPPATTQWMIVCMAIIPILLVGSMVLIYLKKYKIDEKYYADIVGEIEEREGTTDITAAETPENDGLDREVGASECENSADNPDREPEPEAEA